MITVLGKLNCPLCLEAQMALSLMGGDVVSAYIKLEDGSEKAMEMFDEAQALGFKSFPVVEIDGGLSAGEAGVEALKAVLDA